MVGRLQGSLSTQLQLPCYIHTYIQYVTRHTIHNRLPGTTNLAATPPSQHSSAGSSQEVWDFSSWDWSFDAQKYVLLQFKCKLSDWSVLTLRCFELNDNISMVTRTMLPWWVMAGISGKFDRLDAGVRESSKVIRIYPQETMNVPNIMGTYPFFFIFFFIFSFLLHPAACDTEINLGTSSWRMCQFLKWSLGRDERRERMHRCVLCRGLPSTCTRK